MCAERTSPAVAVRLRALQRKKEMKRGWIHTNTALRNQIRKLTQEIESSLFRNRIFSSDRDVHILEREERRRSTALESLRTSIRSSRDSLSNRVSRLQNRIDVAIANHREDHLRTIESQYGEVDQLLLSMKSNHQKQLEQLHVDQSKLENELKVLHTAIDARERRRKVVAQRHRQQRRRVRRSKISKSKSKSKSRRAVSAVVGGGQRRASGSGSLQVKSEIPVEVRRYDEFVRSQGGVSGGWDDQTHGFFTKVMKRYKGCNDGFIREMIRRVPSLSGPKIQEHYQFIQKLEKLRNEKREAIEEWREQKRRAKIERLQLQESDADLREADVLEKKRRLMMKKRLVAKKRRVEDWRKKKAREEASQMRQQEAKKRQAQMARRRQRFRRQGQIRERVKEFRLARQRDTSMKNRELIHTIQNRRKVSSQDLKALRERDQRVIERRRALLESKKEREGSAEARFARYLHTARTGPRVARDPSRLVQKTAAQLAREKQIQKQKRRGSGSVDSGFILHAQRRITPSWRAGL